MPELQASTSSPAARSSNEKSRFWLFAAVGFLLLALVVAGIAWIVRGPSGVNDGASPETPNVRSTLHLDTFVINLADPEEKAYLRVGIDLGLSGELKAKSGQGGPPVAQARDAILTVLSVYKPDELLTPAGKAKLKSEIVQRLQQQVPELGVREPYFTDFLVQR